MTTPSPADRDAIRNEAHAAAAAALAQVMDKHGHSPVILATAVAGIIRGAVSEAWSARGVDMKPKRFRGLIKAIVRDVLDLVTARPS